MMRIHSWKNRRHAPQNERRDAFSWRGSDIQAGFSAWVLSQCGIEHFTTTVYSCLLLSTALMPDDRPEHAPPLIWVTLLLSADTSTSPVHAHATALRYQCRGSKTVLQPEVFGEMQKPIYWNSQAQLCCCVGLTCMVHDLGSVHDLYTSRKRRIAPAEACYKDTR